MYKIIKKYLQIFHIFFSHACYYYFCLYYYFRYIFFIRKVHSLNHAHIFVCNKNWNLFLLLLFAKPWRLYNFFIKINFLLKITGGLVLISRGYFFRYLLPLISFSDSLIEFLNFSFGEWAVFFQISWTVVKYSLVKVKAVLL